MAVRALLATAAALLTILISATVQAEPSRLSSAGKALTMGDVWFDCHQPEPVCSEPHVLVCRKKTNPLVLWIRHKCDALCGCILPHRQSACCDCASCAAGYECEYGY